MKYIEHCGTYRSISQIITITKLPDEQEWWTVAVFCWSFFVFVVVSHSLNKRYVYIWYSLWPRSRWVGRICLAIYSVRNASTVQAHDQQAMRVRHEKLVHQQKNSLKKSYPSQGQLTMTKTIEGGWNNARIYYSYITLIMLILNRLTLS